MTKACKTYIQSMISAADEGITPVISLRPGGGKSTFIIEQMAQAIQNNKGLVVVTDSIERLNRLADEAIENYVEANPDKIHVLTSKNYYSELANARKKPVVLLTTQRVQRMTPREMNLLLAENEYKPKQIFIDEQPLLVTTIDIDIRTLNDIDVALHEITNLENQQEKQMLLDAFALVNHSIREAFQRIEDSNVEEDVVVDCAVHLKKQKRFSVSLPWYDKRLQESADIIEEYAEKFHADISRSNYDAPYRIDTLVAAIRDGAEITSVKQKPQDNEFRYRNFLTYVKDFHSWYENISAQVVIFDGSAAVSPLYDDPIFQVIDCSHYEKAIPRLTVKLINANTSKSTLAKKPDYRQCLIDYVRSIPDLEAVFTYKDFEKLFKSSDSQSFAVNHFGNLRGLNDYNQMTCIAQVGLPLMPHWIYGCLCSYILLREKERTDPTPANTTKWSIYPQKTLYDFRNRMLLAEIVQNIFRSKIRNENCDSDVTVNLIFGYKGYKNNSEIIQNYQLAKMIEQYFQRLGAKVEYVDTPDIIKEYKTRTRKSKEGQTDNIQKFLDWYDEQDGTRTYSTNDLSIESGVDPSKVHATIKQNRFLNEHIVYITRNLWAVKK